MYYLLANMVQKDPGVIIGPISKAMGWVIDLAFNAVSLVTEKYSLGFSIIALTIVVRFVMVPLAIKSHKSMTAMQKLNPEIEKIKAKYGNTKDPELSRKMNMEMQALYSKHKVNPLSGCLPMLIQMPIFFALSYLMNQSYLYISKLGSLYHQLASKILEIPHSMNVMVGIIKPHVPDNMKDFNISAVDNMVKGLNKLSQTDWNNVFSGLGNYADAEKMNAIRAVYDQKQNIETFFGLSLLDPSGWAWPGILIPLLTAGTTLLSSWLSMKMTQTSRDGSAKMQQRIMMIVMPLMMGFFTVNYPSGVGLYWITSSVFQAVQQYIMNKKYRGDIIEEASKK